MSTKKIETRTKILEAAWKLLERDLGQGVSMAEIAAAAGVSRQAVYLHFESRTELLLATTKYVDEVKGLAERMQRFESAQSGVEALEAIIDVWGNYIPEIYGIARALRSARETDEDAAAAWDDCMGCVREACRATVNALASECRLSLDWPAEDAVAMLYSLLSIGHWEQLTLEEGWTTESYVERMKVLLFGMLVR